MKRENRYLIPIFAFSSSFLLANISYSAWNVSNGSPEKEFVFKVSNKHSVAYFYDTKNIKREFGSVASALAVAANYANDSNKILVVVNPDTTGNVKIGDCTIAANVTLLINYKDVKSTRADKDLGDEYTGNASNGTTFGDVTGSKSKIYLNGKRTINNGGALIIGGETGQDGALFQGGTIGNCAELNVDAGGSIDCSGEIISYGFIHDLLEGKRSDNESAIVIHKGGKVSEPLTRYTWPGGSEALLSMKPKKIFPCNVFDLPNIRAPMLFEYGSKLIGKGKINAFKNFFTAEADIITQDDNIGFLQLKEKGRKATSGDKWTGNAGSVLFDADDRANDKKTTSDSTHYVNHKTKIKAMGDASISGVSVTVSVETLDTREGYLPISGIFDIELQKACFNVMYDTKILPGANVVVNSDSSLTFKKNLVVYSSTTDKNGNKMNPYAFNGQTNFENNGTLKMESGADVLISTTKTDSKVIVGASYSKPSECLERVASKNYKGFEFTNGANRNRLAQRYAIDGTTSYIYKGNENAVANRTYTSSATSDGKYGWTYNNEYKSYPIVIETNGNDSAVDSNGQKYIENYGSGTTLSNLTSKDPDKTFVGFYYDQACTKALDKNASGLYYVNPDRMSSYLTNNCLKVYAKWISGYTVHFKYRKYSTDHLSKYTEIDSSTIIKKADLGDTYSLNPNNDIKLSPDYYFEYNGNNSSIPANQFNCYYDVVSSIQVVHRSSDGTSTTTNITSDNISNLSSWPTSDWVTGDTIEVVVSYKTTRKQSDITINVPGTIGAGKSGTATIKNFDKAWFADRNIAVSIQWSDEGKPDEITTEKQGDSLKITNHSEKEDKTKKFDVQLAATFENSTLGNAKATINYKGACVSFDTLVLMADGTYKKAGDIEIGDQVLAFNHYTGKVVPAVIAFNDIDKVDDYNIVHLIFSNGKTIKIASEHGFFDVDLKRYVYITETNYQNFIGHHFLEISNNTKRIVTLTDAYARIEHIGVCSPGTAKYFNIITNDRLSITGGLPGLFNYFDLDDDFTINREKMEKDIKRYGLFDYSHYSSYRSREAFDAFNIKYLKISRGKGLITEEEFIALLTRYARFVH